MRGAQILTAFPFLALMGCNSSTIQSQGVVEPEDRPKLAYVIANHCTEMDRVGGWSYVGADGYQGVGSGSVRYNCHGVDLAVIVRFKAGAHL